MKAGAVGRDAGLPSICTRAVRLSYWRRRRHSKRCCEDQTRRNRTKELGGKSKFNAPNAKRDHWCTTVAPQTLTIQFVQVECLPPTTPQWNVGLPTRLTLAQPLDTPHTQSGSMVWTNDSFQTMLVKEVGQIVKYPGLLRSLNLLLQVLLEPARHSDEEVISAASKLLDQPSASSRGIACKFF